MDGRENVNSQFNFNKNNDSDDNDDVDYSREPVENRNWNKKMHI